MKFFVIEHWEVDVPLNSIVDPEHFCAVIAYCDPHKPGYIWVKHYFLQHIELADGTVDMYISAKVKNQKTTI